MKWEIYKRGEKIPERQIMGMSQLERVLNGQTENFLYPFFWLHGEEQQALKEYVEKIYAAGIRGFCVESRPHPAYGEERWWEDLAFLCEEAKKRQMKIWILDDAKFPTGYANGWVKEHYPHLRKTYLDCRRFDVVGPLKNGRMILRYPKGKPWEQASREQDKIVGVFAARRNLNVADGEIDVFSDTLVDITEQVRDGILYYDFSTGTTCVFVLLETYVGGEENTKDYINPLDEKSTRVLLEAVYEPHYEHLKEYFGSTITAFFSDEPRFGNQKGCECRMGTKNMVLPWKHGLEKQLPFDKKELVFLFENGGGCEKEIRYQYMDLISNLYARNFSEVLGNWCKEHRIDYVGHQIEDNGAHTRLGYGCGHLFRAQKGQTYSGIDVISNQIAPGYDFYHDAFSAEGHHGEFYHYALASLGASIAQLDPKKRGRAMCEAFGAYGWNEGLKLMKWITDHLLVHGINVIVPHAFNPRKFPDWDCPPHFYAHGNNPQYRYYHLLNAYTNRLCALLQNGIHQTPVAVLYHAEAEWYGMGMPVETVLRELSHHQIECMIVPADELVQFKKTGKGQVQICKNKFSCVIIPYSKILPQKLLLQLKNLTECGCEVLFVDAYPDNLLIEKRSDMQCVPLGQIAVSVEKYANARLSKRFENIVPYCYEAENEIRYFIFQEHPYEEYDGFIELRAQGVPMLYDACQNECRSIAYEVCGAFVRLPLHLKPHEACMIIFRKEWVGIEEKEPLCDTWKLETVLAGVWQVQVSDAKHYPVWETAFEIEKLEPLSNREAYLDYTGTARYEIEFELTEVLEHVEIDCGMLYEIGEIFVNGCSAGVKICPPYQFDITGYVRQGNNQLVIEVTNNLGNQCKEFMTQYLPIEPFGLVGPVVIRQG